MAQLTDHLWQSTLVLLLIASMCLVLHGNSAALRLAMWRMAALKFLLPFSLLFAVGSWLGFPVRHSAIPPPAGLTDAFAAGMPWFAPVQTIEPGKGAQAGALALLLAIALVGLGWIAANLRRVSAQQVLESARAGTEAGWQPTRPGFLKATLLAAAAVGAVMLPITAGALHDRVLRQQALAIDIARLRSAALAFRETPSRFGSQTEIVAQTDGVLIRYINLQDLVALVYGIGQFEVFGGALPWLEDPHYDVRITGPVHAPRLFDPYSLRQPVTDYLSREYGVAIRVNGSCQEPCLNQESIVVERLPWTLAQKLRGQK